MPTSSSSNNLLNLLAIKKQSNRTSRISLNGNALHNFIENTPFTTIPFYEDNLNLLKKKNILRLDLTHPAFDHLCQTLPLQNIPPLEYDNNNTIVHRQG